MRLSILALLCCSCTASAVEPKMAPRQPPGVAAGDVVRPTAYRLTLELDPDSDGFRGRVEIDLDVLANSRIIELHSVELAVARAVLVQGDQSQRAEVSPAPQRERLVLRFDADLEVGRAVLALDFSGTFGTEVGLFKQRAGSHAYVFTDFQPIDARRAFPCFDEPRFRTPFSLTVVAPSQHVVASNGVVVSKRTLSGGRSESQFRQTPPIPTYLVAVTVGPFEVVKGPDAPVPVRVLALRGRSHEARAAITLMPRYLEHVARYTDIPVPIRKLDLVAVPKMDGAMENHALFLFDDDLLLLPAAAGARHRHMVHMVLAHEAAHVWFGNLVGFRRWQDLWLSEGFATLIADEIGMAFHPEEHIEVRQMLYRYDAMLVDRDPWARAIDEIGSGERAAERAFDPLSYKKAGAVLSMIQAGIGRSRFRAAVRRYLRPGRSRVAAVPDLAAALAAEDPRVPAVIASFTSQSSFPVLAATVSCEQGKAARVDIEQRADPWLKLAALRPGPAKRPWHLPLCVAYGPDARADNRRKVCGWMTSSRMSLPLESCPAWVFANAGGNAYARLAVDEQSLSSLTQAPLTPRERATLLDSLAAEIQVGSIGTAAAAPHLERAHGVHETELAIRLVRALSRSGAFSQRELVAAGGALVRRAMRVLWPTKSGPPPGNSSHKRDLLLVAGLELADPAVRKNLKAAAIRALDSGPKPGDDRELVIAALEVFADNLDLAAVERFARDTATAPSARIPYRIGVLASLRRSDGAQRALTFVLGHPRLAPFASVLVMSYASTPAVAPMVLKLAATRRELLTLRPAAELRQGFGRGLCNLSDLRRLDELLPPPPADMAAASIRRCAAQRRIVRR